MTDTVLPSAKSYLQYDASLYVIVCIATVVAVTGTCARH